jgi:hypothetical protein
VHALTVGADGRLSESSAAVTFSPADVPAAARLQGVVAVAARSDHDGHDHGHSRQDGGDDSLVESVGRLAPAAFSKAPVLSTDRASPLSKLLKGSGD